MGNGNGKTKLIIFIIGSAIATIAALKAWILLPEQVAVQAAQNTKEHLKYEDDIENLDDEGMAVIMDVVEIKGNIKHIITEQGHQEKRQSERHTEILDKIKELHK